MPEDTFVEGRGDVSRLLCLEATDGTNRWIC